MRWINFVFFKLSLCSWSLGLHQVIIKERQKIVESFKESTEAELSYLTERHGFVDDENVQHSGVYVDPVSREESYVNPVEKFLHQFVSTYLDGYTAYDTLITRSHFEDPMKKMRLCPTYLRDPIFDRNHIEFIQNPERHSVLYETKFVEFQYFTRKLEVLKVVRCPVTVEKFVTRLYFLEIHYMWRHSGPQRGYFVFINKVVPGNQSRRQPLILLMYIDPDRERFPEMDTEGTEAETYDALDLVSSHTMKLILRDVTLQRTNVHEIWTASAMINKMKEKQRQYGHYFGEEAEMMLIAKLYGFMEIPSRRGRPWRMKRTLLTLDHMAKDYLVDREKMDAVKHTEPRKTCRNYILLNDELTKRQIAPREEPGGAEYVTKYVDFTKFEYPAGATQRELLKCPITFGEAKQQRTIYLLPIHYVNSAKLPQLFTFFDDPRRPDMVNVYLLSPVFAFADAVDYDFVDPDVGNLAEASSTSAAHQPQTTADLEIPPSSRAADSVRPSTSRTTGPVDSDTASHPTSTRASDSTLLPTDSFVGGLDFLTLEPR